MEINTYRIAMFGDRHRKGPPNLLRQEHRKVARSTLNMSEARFRTASRELMRPIYIYTMYEHVCIYIYIET